LNRTVELLTPKLVLYNFKWHVQPSCRVLALWSFYSRVTGSTEQIEGQTEKCITWSPGSLCLVRWCSTSVSCW